MKLSEYARREGIAYRAAWNRYKAGKIEGAHQDEHGRIRVPENIGVNLGDAAIYARVSDPSKRKTQLPSQRQRMEEWAVMNGYRVVESVAEVGSGLNENRKGLKALLLRDTWGTLIVEHKDRLTRFGFNWFKLFIEAQGREIIVVNEVHDDRADIVQDLISIIYSFSARLYGKRKSERAKTIAAIITSPEETDG